MSFLYFCLHFAELFVFIQVVNEKLGRTTKTIDPEMEKKIESLVETQSRYNRILTLAKALNSHMFNVIQVRVPVKYSFSAATSSLKCTNLQVQKALADVFSDLSFKQPELQQSFASNSSTQKSLAKNGDKLLSAIRFFTDALDTLINKTMQDTLLTIKQYQYARVQYDALRNEHEADPSAATAPTANGSFQQQDFASTTPNSSSFDSHSNLEVHKSRFEGLHRDVDVKLKLLDENKVGVLFNFVLFSRVIGCLFQLKVMSRQLTLFETALAAFMSGNASELDTVVKEFKIKVTEQTEPASFLEFH